MTLTTDLAATSNADMRDWVTHHALLIAVTAVGGLFELLFLVFKEVVQ